MSVVSNDAAEVARRIHGEGSGVGARARRALAALTRTRRGQIGFALLALFLIIAVFGPFLAPQDPNAASSFSTSAAQNLASPSSAHVLGTDEQGRDVLSEVLYAARISLSVGLAAALISTLLGALIGIVAGYFGGWVDRILMAVDDWVLVIPFIPTAIVIASLLGRRADNWPLGRESVLVLVIGALGWAGTSRIVRSQVLTLKERDYVQRARVLGSSDRTIMARHILPGVLPLVLANAVLYISVSVLAETTLAFLGLGDPQNFSWGQMLNSAYESGAMTQAKWAYFIPPGLCVTLLAMAFSLVGYGLEEIVNPTRRERA
jgi:peptide/nickel transport system permease protein